MFKSLLNANQTPFDKTSFCISSPYSNISVVRKFPTFLNTVLYAAPLKMDLFNTKSPTTDFLSVTNAYFTKVLLKGNITQKHWPSDPTRHNTWVGLSQIPALKTRGKSRQPRLGYVSSFFPVLGLTITGILFALNTLGSLQESDRNGTGSVSRPINVSDTTIFKYSSFRCLGKSGFDLILLGSGHMTCIKHINCHVYSW